MSHRQSGAHRKLICVAIAMAIFAALGAVTTAAVGRPVEIGTTNAVLIGLGIGLFEEFYVQSARGNWLRAMHPLRSIPVYILVVIVLYFVAVHISHLLLKIVSTTYLWSIADCLMA